MRSMISSSGTADFDHGIEAYSSGAHRRRLWNRAGKTVEQESVRTIAGRGPILHQANDDLVGDEPPPRPSGLRAPCPPSSLPERIAARSMSPVDICGIP